MWPTKLLQSLEVVGQHTMSFGALRSRTIQISTQWCEASYSPPAYQLAQRIVVGESPGSQNRKNPYPSDGDAAGS
jgi:hypothetical protein